MPKMTEKQVRTYLGQLIDEDERIKGDHAFADNLLKAHLYNIPNGRLYKYRECNNQNFRALADNCIWMASADSFQDLFDCTVNIDLRRNASQIKKWLKESLPEYVYYIWQYALEKSDQKCPLTIEEFLEGVATCMDANGNINTEEYYSYAQAHHLVQNRKEFDEQMALSAQIFSRVPEKEDEIIRLLSEGIEKQRSQVREKALVYSMSDSFDNDGLWENYANGYTGYCVGYSFKNCDLNQYPIAGHLLKLLPVIYRKRRPIYDLAPVFDGVMRERIFPGLDESWKKPLLLNLNMQLYYKRDTYSFEREWRFLMDDIGENKQSFPFVYAIYAGKDIKPHNLQRLCNIAEKLNVPVYQQTPNKAKNGYDYILIKEEKHE